jgi:ferric-dicitrate binding protein FerR (iron transport regulator)
MSHDDELDRQLRPAFDALRRADAQAAPSFDAMFAAARAQADVQAGVQAGVQAEAQPRVSPRRYWKWAAFAAPLAAAAGLAIWLVPERAGDREFERAVAEWSRTDRSLPTDGLLAVPGSEYLRRLPSLGTGAAESGRP